MYDMESCGKRIKELRKGMNLTRERLSEELHTSVYHLRGMESGREGASIDLLVDIADYFGVTLDYLILGKKGIPGEMKSTLVAVAGALLELAEKL